MITLTIKLEKEADYEKVMEHLNEIDEEGEFEGAINVLKEGKEDE